MPRTLFIFGRRTAEEVYEAAVLRTHDSFDTIEKHNFEDEFVFQQLVPRIPAGAEVSFHVAIANIPLRRSISEQCEALTWTPYTIIHPSAVVSPSAKIGKGVFVGPLAVISSHAMIDDYSLIHIHASVGHDASVGRYCNVLPGARISGNAKIHDGCLVGSNAFVNAGITIGENSQVDALTYVARDLPSNMLLSVRSSVPLPRIPVTKNK